jgi:hypothetical protein
MITVSSFWLKGEPTGTILSYISPLFRRQSGISADRLLCLLLASRLFLGLFCNSEDESDILLRKVRWLSTDYMELYPRSQNSLIPQLHLLGYWFLYTSGNTGARKTFLHWTIYLKICQIFVVCVWKRVKHAAQQQVSTAMSEGKVYENIQRWANRCSWYAFYVAIDCHVCWS